MQSNILKTLFFILPFFCFATAAKVETNKITEYVTFPVTKPVVTISETVTQTPATVTLPPNTVTAVETKIATEYETATKTLMMTTTATAVETAVETVLQAPEIGNMHSYNYNELHEMPPMTDKILERLVIDILAPPFSKQNSTLTLPSNTIPKVPNSAVSNSLRATTAAFFLLTTVIFMI